MARPAGSARFVLVDSVSRLHPEEALFEAMLDGWRRQHAARRLSPTITAQRQRTIRRFAEFTAAWPWQWRAELSRRSLKLAFSDHRNSRS